MNVCTKDPTLIRKIKKQTNKQTKNIDLRIQAYLNVQNFPTWLQASGNHDKPSEVTNHKSVDLFPCGT